MKKCIESQCIGRGTFLSIKRATRLLGVSSSGFYQWLESDPAYRFGVAHSDQYILAQSKSVIADNKEAKCGLGLLNIYQALRNKGISISVPRLRHILRTHGIFHRWHRKFVKTTDSDHNLARFPNLIERRFDEFGVNEAWCGDITYIPTEEGWLYLASVIDLKTRRLVGYCFSNRMSADIVIKALEMAYKAEKPTAGCIFHSDQGSQYCSHAFQALLNRYGFRCSMSERGQCWDNAPAESFWATLKRECMPWNGCFVSRLGAQREIVSWIRYYNGKRPHSKLDGKSPMAYLVGLLVH